MNIKGFFKTSRYQRFHVEPRYYDPIKEDIANRTSRIKAEMGLTDSEVDPGYRSQIEGSFRKNMKHTPSQVGGQAAMLRMIIFIILVLAVGGFVYLGSEVFYLFLLFVPFYLWKRFKK
ncbi:MAG: hypothetical protein HEP71_08375 [Roseivirga sp.]|nr:hypothetical protein [Roseivirga sp.]